MQSVLNVEGISKSFGPKRVLRGLDLTAYAQETIALMGPNGAGKTTLLNILATLMAADSGTVTYFGQPLRGNENVLRQRLGLVGHPLMLYADLTAEENLHFYAKMYAVTHSEERVTDMLELVGLTRQRQQVVRTLSRGMQQRLSIARALLHDPEILFLDEPFTGLDQAMTERMLQLVRQITGQAKTVIFTSHHFNEVEALATRVLLLKAGNFVDAWEVAGMDAGILAERYQAAFQRGG